jgi:hypothetical protein
VANQSTKNSVGVLQRMSGANAVNNDEFITLAQLNAATSGLAGPVTLQPDQIVFGGPSGPNNFAQETNLRWDSVNNRLVVGVPGYSATPGESLYVNGTVRAQQITLDTNQAQFLPFISGGAGGNGSITTIANAGTIIRNSQTNPVGPALTLIGGTQTSIPAGSDSPVFEAFCGGVTYDGAASLSEATVGFKIFGGSFDFSSNQFIGTLSTFTITDAPFVGSHVTSTPSRNALWVQNGQTRLDDVVVVGHKTQGAPFVQHPERQIFEVCSNHSVGRDRASFALGGSGPAVADGDTAHLFLVGSVTGTNVASNAEPVMLTLARFLAPIFNSTGGSAGFPSGGYAATVSISGAPFRVTAGGSWSTPSSGQVYALVVDQDAAKFAGDLIVGGLGIGSLPTLFASASPARLGFWGSFRTSQPIISGSCTTNTAAVLSSLMVALGASPLGYGLVQDFTTP